MGLVEAPPIPFVLFIDALLERVSTPARNRTWDRHVPRMDMLLVVWAFAEPFTHEPEQRIPR